MDSNSILDKPLKEIISSFEFLSAIIVIHLGLVVFLLRKLYFQGPAIERVQGGNGTQNQNTRGNAIIGDNNTVTSNDQSGNATNLGSGSATVTGGHNTTTNTQSGNNINASNGGAAAIGNNNITKVKSGNTKNTSHKSNVNIDGGKIGIVGIGGSIKARDVHVAST